MTLDLFEDAYTHLTHAPTGDDWYTPPHVFETLGLRFDLDVCAPIGGVAWIPAEDYYSRARSCLEHPWHGRVWMNPPYSNPTPFVERWVEHGNGVALLPASNGRWFLNLWGNSEVSFVAAPKFEFYKLGTLAGVNFRMFLCAIGDPANRAAIERFGKSR